MALKKHFETLVQLMAALPDEQAAIDHFTGIRWAHGPFCPYGCVDAKIYHFSDKRTHKCGQCRKRFSIKVGTIFEDTKVPLRLWMLAVWMITSHKKGIASATLANDLGVTQKTSWFMLHRLRHAIRTQSFNRPLSGEIECDDANVGGKEKNKHASKRDSSNRGTKGKTTVFGILERGGELRTGTVPNLRARTVQGIIRQHVAPGSTIMTDEHTSFVGLQGDYNHHAVNHSAGEYVRHFCLHSNGIESVWALFKRQIVGTHHWLSPKHLNRYLGEMQWRFNLREMDGGDRVNALLEQTTGRLTYKTLIA